jgi:hypothetical protein
MPTAGRIAGSIAGAANIAQAILPREGKKAAGLGAIRRSATTGPARTALAVIGTAKAADAMSPAGRRKS